MHYWTAFVLGLGIFFMNVEVEIWKDVPNYEDLFKINQFYHVVRKQKSSKNSRGNTFRLFPEKIREYKIGNHGYYIIKFRIGDNYKSLLKHRLVWEYHNGKIPDNHIIHHIDENKLNNDISNLKCINKREHMHEHKYSIYQSQYIGIDYDKRGKKWLARICFKNRKIRLGLYKLEIDAHNAYQNALKLINEGVDLNNLYPVKEKRKGHKGIYKEGNKWRTIYAGKHIGMFETEEIAIEKRKKFIQKLNNKNHEDYESKP